MTDRQDRSKQLSHDVPIAIGQSALYLPGDCRLSDEIGNGERRGSVGVQLSWTGVNY